MKPMDLGSAGEAVNTTLESAGRGIRHLRHSAEDALEETRHTIKTKPFTTVLAAALVGVVAGVALGWIIGSGLRD